MKDSIKTFFSSDISQSPLSSLLIYFSVFFITINIVLVIAYLVCKYAKKSANSQFCQFISILIKNTKVPSLFLTIFSSLYLTISLLVLFYPQINLHQNILVATTVPYLIKLLFSMGFFWLIWRVLYSLQIFIYTHTKMGKNSWFTAFFSLISNAIKAAIILLIVNMIIPWLGLTDSLQSILAKISQILFIGILGWIFFQLITEGTNIVLTQYGGDKNYDFTARKIRTQVIILKRIILTIGIIIVCAAILLTFDNVNRIGVSLLTTAGIISAIGAFASQQSLSRLAAGLQMAFTQPIRIGDTVMIDNETGTVEEISLSYIVVKLWNLRRLILPADYLTKKGFQNLSRTSTQLIDAIFVYTDFALPIQPIREKFFELLAESKFWDGHVKAFHVTAVTNSNIELRALMSAEDGGSLWELQCEMREKLIEFIVKNYSIYLPRQRTVNEKD